jgi:hypothetical protein
MTLRHPLLFITLLLSLPASSMASTEIQLEENLGKLDPAITTHVKKVAEENDESGNASVYISTLVHGDIDGDSKKDAVVSFAVQNIGGGNFSRMFQALFLNRNGRLTLAAVRNNDSFGLGPGKSFVPTSISKRKVLGHVVEYAEGDEPCCPSSKRDAALIYAKGKLIERYGNR